MDIAVASQAMDGLPGSNHPEFIGQSAAILRVKQAALAVAGRSTTLMLLGETGSGKEMLARYVHRHSARANKPFIGVDCSAFSEALFESQLFGHVKGAFTGAVRDTIGFMRAASGGTFFLDEVGELTLPLQAKLLRVLQERTVVPVGDTNPHPVDIRLICATNRDLSNMVDLGTFRRDLFFRLNVVTLAVPPLRERTTDIPILAERFLATQATLANEQPKRLSPEAENALVQYSWPGNIRELFNCLEHAHVLSDGATVEIDALPAAVRRHFAAPAPEIGDLNLAALERRVIIEALRRTRGNRAAAGRLLGLEPRRLNRRLAAFHIAV
jgi:transcriptional regulator with PAS, ATPase and Fis domain